MAVAMKNRCKTVAQKNAGKTMKQKGECQKQWKKSSYKQELHN